MKKQLILAALLIIPALGYAAHRDAGAVARVRTIGANRTADVVCGPEVCVQLVPFRTGIGRYKLVAPVESGS